MIPTLQPRIARMAGGLQTLSNKVDQIEQEQARLQRSRDVLDVGTRLPTVAKASNKADAQDALWTAFTDTLGGAWSEAKADGQSLGGVDGIGKRIDQLDKLKGQLARLIGEVEEKPNGIPKDTQRQVALAYRTMEAGDAVRKAGMPELEGAIEALAADQIQDLHTYTPLFSDAVNGKAPLVTALDEPEGFPAFGAKKMPEYLRDLAKQIKRGKGDDLVLRSSFGFGPEPISKGDRAEVARKLNTMADCRDPKSRHYAPGGFDASFGHFALKWDGKLGDFFRALDRTDTAMYNSSVHDWKPWAAVKQP